MVASGYLGRVSSLLHPPGVFHVLDRRGLAGFEADSDRIEAIDVLRTPKPVYPGGGDLLDFPALLPGYRLERVTKARAGTGLHLHESDDLAATYDEIDLLPAHAEVAEENAPSGALKEPGCQVFTPVPQLLGHPFRPPDRLPAPEGSTWA
jgi:hypothetical protein